MKNRVQILNTKQGIIVKIGNPDTEAAYKARRRRAEKKLGVKLVPVSLYNHSVLSDYMHSKRWSLCLSECRIFSHTSRLQSSAGQLLQKKAECTRLINRVMGPHRGWIEDGIQRGIFPRILARMAVNPMASMINFDTPKLP